jgi:hypothetical protein
MTDKKTNDELVDDAKRLNPIEQIVAETPGFTLTGHGRYLTTREHDSLIIDTHTGGYHYNSAEEHGDVINWIEHRNGWDFKATVEWLCRRAGIAEPDWGAGSPGQRIAARARMDVYDAATEVFTSYLWADKDALAYPQRRGWTDETIKTAMLGYTGNADQREAVKGALIKTIVEGGGDPQSPAAVAMVGYRGDVRRWMLDHELNPEEQSKWIEQGFIPGLVGRDMLIYPHVIGGRVVYLSGRRIHVEPGEHNKSYNLPVTLAGQKQIYCNWIWSSKVMTCVVTEGQANAVTLAQWGLPAVALMGTSVDEHTARFLGVGDADREVAIYLALDSDAAGKKAVGMSEEKFKPGLLAENKYLRFFGPTARVLDWKGIGGIDTYIDQTDPERPEREVTDANDLLRGMIA